MRGKRPATIQRRRDFLAATKGSKFVTGTFILQAVAREAAHPAGVAPRIGFTVTRKMGNAVKRNRIKRRLRAAAAKIFAGSARDGYDYVIISRVKALDCPFSDLTRDMEFAFSRIIYHKNPDSHVRT